MLEGDISTASQEDLDMVAMLRGSVAPDGSVGYGSNDPKDNLPFNEPQRQIPPATKAEAKIETAEAPEADEPEELAEEVSEEKQEEPVKAGEIELADFLDEGQTHRIPKSLATKFQSLAEERTSLTSQVANERQQIEAAAAHIRQQHEAYNHGLNQLQSFLQATAPQEPNWEQLKAQLPIDQYLYARENFRDEVSRHNAKMQGVWQEQQNLQQQEQAQAAQRQEQWDQQAALQLVHSNEAWVKDNNVLQNDMKLTREYVAQAYGYTPEQIQETNDPRVVSMANKARLYDDLVRQSKTMQSKVVKTPALSAGSNAPRVNSKSTVNDEMKRFIKGGANDDDLAVAAMRKMQLF